jgi:hypothetical protein
MARLYKILFPVPCSLLPSPFSFPERVFCWETENQNPEILQKITVRVKPLVKLSHPLHNGIHLFSKSREDFGDAEKTGTISPVRTDINRDSDDIKIILILAAPKDSM